MLRARTLLPLLAGAIVLAWGAAASLPNALAGRPLRGADAPAYCRIARALLEGHVTLPPPSAIDRDPQYHPESAFGSPYARARGGRWYPKHPVLFALLLAPGIALAGNAGALATGLLLSALLSWFVTARVSEAFGAPAAFAGAMAVLLGTPAVRAVLFEVNVDVLLALAMVAAFALASDGRAAAAGVLAGGALLLRPTAALLVAPALLLLLRRGPRRFAGALLLALALAGLGNTLVWGAPWTTGYGRVLVQGEAGWRTVDVAELFHGSAAQGLRILLFDPAGGFLTSGVVAAIGLLGFALPAARRAEWLLASAGAALALLALVRYDFLRAVPEGSIRFAFPLVVSAAPPLAALLDSFRRGRARA